MTPAKGNLTRQIGRMNSEGFDGLYREHKSAVYRFAYFLARNREEADDLFQETWLRVVQHLPRASGVQDVRAWVFTVTANLHRDVLRKKRIRRLFYARKFTRSSGQDESLKELSISKNMGRTDDSECIDMGMAIMQAMARLPDRQRSVFVLKEIEGFKHVEISEILGLPVGTTKSLLHRAVKRLQRDLIDYRPNRCRYPQST